MPLAKPITAALVFLSMAGCGSSGSGAASLASKPKLSPQQYDNAQRVATYIPALHQVMAPFSRPPANPTNLALADRLLRRAITQLKQLTPPTGFTKSQQDLVRALEAQVAVTPQLAAALRSKAPIALNNAEARVAQAGGQVRAAIAEGSAELAKCKANNATC